MNEIEFWKIMKMLDWDKTGDDDSVVKPVVDYLSKQSNEDIYKFEDILSEKLYSLDTIDHAKHIGEDAYVDDDTHFSVDWFLYARCVIIANGQELYDDVMNNPENFPKDLEFEALLYVAQEAYEKKNETDWDYSSPVSYETFSNSAGWNKKQAQQCN